MEQLLQSGSNLFDAMHHFWEHPRTQRKVASVLVLVFLAALAVIQLRRWGLLPEPLASLVPENHLHAVSLAFTLVLAQEVLSLIFVLPSSVSKSVGMQFEILALIMLRNAFKHLVYFPEPIDLHAGMGPLYRIAAEAGGALLIFIALGAYYRLMRKAARHRIPNDLYHFVVVKKVIALFLLGIFIGAAGWHLWTLAVHGKGVDFFITFYTVLIFSDILIVLVSQRYLPAFHAVFRNSGYALATLLMRLALSAPAYWDIGIGVGASAYAVSLTLAYNTFYPDLISPSKGSKECE